jgi:hypothetical protein
MKFEGARARNFVEQKKKIVPILVFFGSQEAVKKFGPKIGFFVVWTSHLSGIPTVRTNKNCKKNNVRWHTTFPTTVFCFYETTKPIEDKTLRVVLNVKMIRQSVGTPKTTRDFSVPTRENNVFAYGT